MLKTMTKSNNQLKCLRIFHPRFGEHVLIAPEDKWDRYDFDFFLSHWKGQIMLGFEYAANSGQSGIHIIYNDFSWASSWAPHFLDLLTPNFPVLMPWKIWSEFQDNYLSYILKPENIARCSKIVMPEMPNNPLAQKGALFLDRDGIINQDFGYVSDVAKINYVNGIFDIFRWAREIGVDVFVMTNQSGIAKGMYTLAQMHEVHVKIQKDVEAAGGQIKQFYFCPYHHEAIDKQYEYYSLLRKPGPGMVFQAAKTHTFSLARSLMIGDKPTDVLIGGVRTVLLQGNYQLEVIRGSPHVPIFKSLIEVLQHLRKIEHSFLPSTL
jgi:D-glycero-D-manno-heptose 1,7-bisphosphate phosphatase